MGNDLRWKAVASGAAVLTKIEIEYTVSETVSELVVDYLLLETGDVLLLETGDKVIL